MRHQNKKPSTDSYQGAASQKRTYQPLDKVYQPKTSVTTSQPPPVSTTTVAPAVTPANNSTQQENGRKK